MGDMKRPKTFDNGAMARFVSQRLSDSESDGTDNESPHPASASAPTHIWDLTHIDSSVIKVLFMKWCLCFVLCTVISCCVTSWCKRAFRVLEPEA